MRKFWKQQKSCYGAFTLAEMMVVMLIMSIILAAMAPVMTTRNKSDYSSPWRYSTNGSDAYFGAGEQQVALIGQHDTTGDDADTKLLINVADNSTFSHILFKKGASILGRLSLDEDNLYLSNTRPNENSERNTTVGINALSANTAGDDNVAIGHNAIATNTDGSLNTAIGSNALNSNTGSGNVAIGANSLQGNTAGTDNIAIGTNSNNVVSGFPANLAKSIAIGYQSTAYGDGAIAIGSSLTPEEGSGENLTGANASAYNSIAIGNGAQVNGGNITTGMNSLAIGTRASSTVNSGIAIGASTQAQGANAIAIGDEAQAGQTNVFTNEVTYGSIAIGPLSRAPGVSSIAIGGSAQSNYTGISIGNEAQAEHYYSISIGNGSNTDNMYSVAIGESSNASGFPSLAIGGYADASGDYSIAIGGGYGNSTSFAPNASGTGAISIGNGSDAVGNYTISIGYGAESKGDNTIALGAHACRYVTGSNKTCIGYDAGPKSDSEWASDDIERIFIGGQSKFDGGTAVLEVHNDATEEGKLRNYGKINKTAVVVHGALIVSGPIYNRVKDAGGERYTKHWSILEKIPDDSDRAKLVRDGNKETADKLYYQDYTHDVTKTDSYCGGDKSGCVVSDRRLKYVGKENTSGLDKIRQLKVFNFTFKKDEKKTPHVGVIAQDLQKVFPDAVKKGVDGFLTIRMEDMFYAVINAIKELDSRVTALEKENQELKSRLDKLEAKIK